MVSVGGGWRGWRGCLGHPSLTNDRRWPMTPNDSRNLLQCTDRLVSRAQGLTVMAAADRGSGGGRGCLEHPSRLRPLPAGTALRPGGRRPRVSKIRSARESETRAEVRGRRGGSDYLCGSRCRCDPQRERRSFCCRWGFSRFELATCEPALSTLDETADTFFGVLTLEEAR